MILKRYIWAALWALLILVLCAIPGRDLPQVEWLEILQFDKWVHASLFFILFYLFARAGVLRWIVFASCVIYGALLEVMQDLVFVDRSFDILDEIANSFGAMMGWLLYSKFDNLMIKMNPWRK